MGKIKAKRVSKKKKESWKRIDDTDVIDFVEEKAFKERVGHTGGKDGEEIFTIDTKPKNLLRESILCPRAKSIDDIKLRCLSALENDSKVQDPMIKRNRVRTKEERRHPALKSKLEKNRRKGIVKKKDLKMLEKFYFKRMCAFEQKTQKRRVVADYDVWEEQKQGDESKLSKAKPFLDETAFVHVVKNTNYLPTNVSHRPQAQKRNISLLELPHPGMSYNPTFDDHAELANEIVKSEMKKEKDEAHLTRVTEQMFKTVSSKEHEKNFMNEMSEGLPLQAVEQNEPESDSDKSDNEYKTVNPPVSRDDHKTRKQKKTKLRLRQEEKKRQEAREEKKKINDIQRIKHIMNEINESEKKREKNKIKRLQKNKRRSLMNTRVCRNKIEPIGPDIAPVSELTGSLREVVPQGNILKEELNKFQSGGLVEVTKPQMNKKKWSRFKKYKLASHRPERIEFSRNEVKEMIKNKRKNK